MCHSNPYSNYIKYYSETATNLHDHPPRGSGAGSRHLTQSLVVDAAVDEQRIAQNDGQLPATPQSSLKMINMLIWKKYEL